MRILTILIHRSNKTNKRKKKMMFPGI